MAALGTAGGVGLFRSEWNAMVMIPRVNALIARPIEFTDQ